MPSYLTNRDDAEQDRQALENRILDVVWPYVREFLLSVQKDAASAVDAPVALAAAANPLAFTNIKSRWMQVVRDLAELSLDPTVPVDLSSMVEELSLSDLPTLAYNECAAILQLSREEGWTNYRTKRHLSKLLVPKQKKEEERSRYRGRIVGLARGGATRQQAIKVLRELDLNGIPLKEWVTCRDERVRATHRAADGQKVPLDEPFYVGGWPMMFPQDRNAPGSETFGCRCVMIGSSGEALAPESTRTMAGMGDHENLSSSYSDWLNDRPEDQREAFERYTAADAYKRWNPYLRGGGGEELSQTDREQIEALQKLIDSSPPLTQDVTVQRGVRNAGEVFGNLRPGDVFEDKAFISTTMDGGMMDYYRGTDSDNAVVHIKIPKGTKAGVASSEGQVILPPGSKLRIVSDDVHETIVDQEGYNMLAEDKDAKGWTDEEFQNQLARRKVTSRTREIFAEVVL